jgi:tRNA(Arg) A34 adenosine deaminase TadA
MIKFLKMAGEIAIPNNKLDNRSFWLAAIGIRKDGVIVSSRNGASEFSNIIPKYMKLPKAHAEGRLIRKLGKGGTVYISRISRKDRSYCMARPCQMCQVMLRGAFVDKVYYTVNNNQYGIWNVRADTDKIYDI